MQSSFFIKHISVRLRRVQMSVVGRAIRSKGLMATRPRLDLGRTPHALGDLVGDTRTRTTFARDACWIPLYVICTCNLGGFQPVWHIEAASTPSANWSFYDSGRGARCEA